MGGVGVRRRRLKMACMECLMKNVLSFRTEQQQQLCTYHRTDDDDDGGPEGRVESTLLSSVEVDFRCGFKVVNAV